MKKELLSIVLFCAVFFAPHVMRASDATALANQIRNYTGGGAGSLTAVASGNTVTVTGTLTGVTWTLNLVIDADVTVEWKADISAGSGFLSNWNQLIWLSGTGIFNVAAGSITATDDVTNSFIIKTDLDSKVTVSGGVVKATAGVAINANNVEVSGGEVSATTGTAIQANGESSTVTISGGTVSSTSGKAISALSVSSTIIVSGTGKVEATGDQGIAIYTNGSVEVSGGEVCVTANGYAIYANDASSTISVTGAGKVTGEEGDAILTYGSVEVNGGEVSNTGTGIAIVSLGWTSTIMVSGGTVSAINTTIFAGSNVEVSGGEVSASSGGYAIYIYQSSSTVTVSGNGQVKSMIYTSGSIIVRDNAQVSATYGSAIKATGDNSTVTVSGGTVSSGMTDNSVILLGNSNNTGLNVVISGTGTVEATSDLGQAIYTYGSVEVSGGKVSATTGPAISALGSSSIVTVSGGIVSGSGGSISISVPNLTNTGLNVIVTGTGKVQATGDGGTAIYTFGSVEVSGGEVTAATGNAIAAFNTNSTITVSGGLVFAYGDAINGSYGLNTVNGSVINANPSIFTGATGTGVVIAWNQAAGNTSYIQGSTVDLVQSPASATVVWDKSGTSFGISYTNGTNTGFIPLNVTVVSAACDVVSVESPAGATISGDSITASVANDVTSQAIALTTSPAASWKLFSDAACTSEITNNIMALSVGENIAYIQVTAENGSQHIYVITVNRAAPSTIAVTGVTLDYTAKELSVGDFLQLMATVFPFSATNRNVSWSSSNSNVVTVSATGLVTAVGAGTANIIVTTEDGGFMAWCIVTVVPPAPSTIAVTGVSLDKTSAILWVGETQQLTAVITPSDATNQSVSWSSSNPAIATVSTTGLITAVGKGAATITAITEDGGYKATCSVVVLQQEVTVPDSTQTKPGGKGNFILSLTIPTDVLFSGSFLLTLPNGVQLDIDSTCLVSGLAAQLSLTITQKSDSSWLFTIAPLSLRSATELVYSQIVEIGYIVGATVAKGTYEATVSDLSFEFDDGSTVAETELPIKLTVSSTTGISDVTAKTDAYLFNGRLYVDSPVSEKIAVYSESGMALYNFKKLAGSVIYTIDKPKGSVFIVKGGSGWVKKVIEK